MDVFLNSYRVRDVTCSHALTLAAMDLNQFTIHPIVSTRSGEEHAVVAL